jgi:dihydrofolate synthase/folylpolyglutamate synthase
MQGVESLQKAVADYLDGRRVICLTGVLADKDWQQMMKVLCSFATDFITVTPDSPRALTNVQLADWLQEAGYHARAAESVVEGVNMALARAKEIDGVVVACGSLYMASEIRTYFGRNI